MATFSPKYKKSVMFDANPIHHISEYHSPYFQAYCIMLGVVMGMQLIIKDWSFSR
jgi:hypothetical protein